MSKWLRNGGCAILILALIAVVGNAEDVSKLIDTIKDKDKAKQTRLAAIDQLGSMGAEAKAAVPLLTKCLRSPNTRENAIVALGKIGPDAKGAMPALMDILLSDVFLEDQRGGFRGRGFRQVNHELLQLRPTIIETMTKIGVEPKKCVPALAKIIAQDDDDQRLRFSPGFRQGCLAAVKALEPLGPKAKDAVPALIQLLDNTAAWQWNPLGPREAMVALAKIGPDAKPALPSLRKRLNHNDPSVAKLAEDAIEKITHPVAAKPPDEVETPAEPKQPRDRQTDLEDTEKPREAKRPPKRRIEVEDDEPVNAGLGKFIDALGDGKVEARDAAIDALTKMGGKAVPALEKAIASPDADMRKNALACLCKMGKNGRAAAPTCIAALKDSSAEVRRNAAYALGRMAADSPEAVAALTAALRDKDREVRLLAAFALEKAQGGK
jgi:HEAT repeat protein